jgi:hypothetical protein
LHLRRLQSFLSQLDFEQRPNPLAFSETPAGWLQAAIPKATVKGCTADAEHADSPGIRKT